MTKVKWLGSRADNITKDIPDYDILLSPPGPMTDKTFEGDGLYVTNSLRIAAQLGNVCTYKCTYCTPFDYDGRFKWPDINRTKRLVDRIHEVYTSPPFNKDTIIWEILGGEITTWKYVEEFISYLKEKGHYIQLITNGVRSERWWKTYGKMFSHVTLSYHPEHANYKHMTNVANILLNQQVAADMLVLMYPPTWNLCLKAIDYMNKNGNFTIHPKKLHDLQNEEGKSKSWKYERGQEEWLAGDRMIHKPYPFSSSDNKSHYTMLQIKSLEDGTFEANPVDAGELVNKGYNNWKGWLCNIGIDTLFINPEGFIRPAAQCFIKEKSYGNWLFLEPEDIQFPYKPSICKYDSCHCVHDIRARKEKL